MKRTIIILAISIILSACKGQPTNWPRAVACAVPDGTLAQAVKDAFTRDGSSEKLSPATEAELKALGVNWGMQAASCAVSWVIDTWMTGGPALAPGQAPPPSPALERAKAFASREGIR